MYLSGASVQIGSVTHGMMKCLKMLKLCGPNPHLSARCHTYVHTPHPDGSLPNGSLSSSAPRAFYLHYRLCVSPNRATSPNTFADIKMMHDSHRAAHIVACTCMHLRPLNPCPNNTRFPSRRAFFVEWISVE